MKKYLYLTGALLLGIAASSRAQVISGNGFIKGTFVEAGLQPNGSFGSKVSAPSDYVSATVSKYSGRVGFIADVGKDGWDNGSPKYIGDFFVPGTPYEAFSVKMNGALYENAGSNPTAGIPGSINGYSSTGSKSTVEWLGTVNNLQVRQYTTIGKNSSYILIRVTLKNTGSSTINNIFYTRSVDPDNEVDQGGSYTTINKIEEQNPGATSTALVSGKGQAHNSYLGLGSRDCRAKVAIMSSFSSDGESIFNGTGDVALHTKNATNTQDDAIAVAFKIGNLAPGDSTTVSMAYVLNAADLPPAMDETDPLFNVKADTYGSGSIINVCSGSTATLNIVNGDGYTWTWSPATNLTSTVGRSVQASLTGDITYTATGINTCGTTRTINLSLHPIVVASPANAGTISGPSTVYAGWNATYSVPAIANATYYKWTIPSGASFVSGFGTNTIVVRYGTGAASGNVTVYGENSCGQGASSTQAVTLSSGSSMTITSDNVGVAGGSPFATASIVDNKIKITGSETISNPRVYIDAGFQSGDVLSYTGTLPEGVTVSYNASTGSLSFSGAATPAEWQAVFREIKFHTTSSNVSDRTIKYMLADVVSLAVGGKQHFYEYVQPGTNPSWAEANVAAAGRTLFGLAGYLATITSASENDFIKTKLLSDGWVGGSDYYQLINEVKGTTHANQASTEGKWFWVTGPEAGTAISTGNNSPVSVGGAFMNWATGEPNNAGEEHYIQLYSTQNGKWNDLAGISSSSVPGYVVEYGGYDADPAVNIYYSRVIKNKPAAPVITSITDDTGNSNTDFITSDKTIRINGTAVANSTVKVTRTGTGVIGTVTADASGNWSYDYSGTTLTEGTHNFTATATAGSVESNSSVAIKVKIDASAPAKPAKPSLDGSVETFTALENPAFKGTAEAGSFVNLYSGTDLIGNTVADASGNWSITSTAVLPEALHQITVKATDTAGNISVASDVFALTVDRTAPDKPASPMMTSGDGIYTNNNKPTIEGNTEPNADVEIYKEGVLITTVRADGSGNWQYTFVDELADGDVMITTKSKDVAGHTSEESDGLIITVDTQKPGKPSTPVLTGGNNGIISNETPTVTGTAEPNTTIEIFIDGVSVSTTAADGSGNWSYTFSPALDDATYAITITAKDKSGNTSDVSDVCTITVDTEKPATPVAPVIDTENNNGIVKTNKPVISGVTEPDAKVHIYDGNILITTITADGTGNWSYKFDPALSEGDHEITFTAEDAAGNVSSVSGKLTVTVDTHVPVAPSIPELNGGNNGNTNNNKPQISGEAEPNSTITIYSNGVPVTTVFADADGKWSYTFSPALNDGDYEITVTATDAAGNTSPQSSICAIHIDTEAPVAPSENKLKDDLNGRTKTSKPTIDGKAEPGSTIAIYNNGVPVATVIADGSGSWTYTFTYDLEDGEHVITATSTDISGNTSAVSGPLTFLVDTGKPETPSAPQTDNTNANGKTKNNKPTINGKAEPGGTVTVYDNGTPVGTVVADENGDWSYTFNPELSDGDHTIITTTTDLAGNTSENGTPIHFGVDTQAPHVTVTTEVTNAKGPFVVTFTFDEPVENFSPEKLMLHNATGSQFTKISDTEYTMLITPSSDKDVRVQLASKAAVDMGGNGSLLSNLLTMQTTFSAEIKEVFPNPASSMLNVRFDGVVSEKCRVIIVKMSGQVVLDQQNGFSSNLLKVDVSRLSAGVYTLIIKSNERTYQKQIVIAR